MTGSVLADSVARVAYTSALTSYYDYKSRGYDHRRRAFEWQLWSSRVIFWVVILLVAAGVAFSAIQFYKSLRLASAPETTQIEASVSGIKVTSSVLGVIILALSLAFFYLYLKEVYHIRSVL